MKDKFMNVLRTVREKTLAIVTWLRNLPGKVTKETLYWLVPALIIVVGLGVLVAVPAPKEGDDADDAEANTAAVVEALPVYGTYASGLLPAASTPGREFTLVLGEDGTAIFTGDYKTGDRLVVETGAWEQTDNRIELTLVDRFGYTLDTPVTYAFEVRDGALVLVDYERARWGDMGLTLTRGE